MEMEKFPFFPIFCYDLKYWLRHTSKDYWKFLLRMWILGACFICAASALELCAVILWHFSSQPFSEFCFVAAQFTKVSFWAVPSEPLNVSSCPLSLFV